MYFNAVPPRIINRSNLRGELIARVGTSSPELSVSFTASPSPTVKWFMNGERLTDTERHSIHTTSERTSLMVHDYLRSDSGVYTVVLENERGRDRIKINVLVIGKISCHFSSHDLS